MKKLMTIYIFLRKIFCKKNLLKKPLIFCYIFFVIASIYYFSIILYLNVKVKNFAKIYNTSVIFNKVSVSGYPFLPKIKIEEFLLKDAKNFQIACINSVNVTVNFNKIFISFKDFKFDGSFSKLEINPIEPIILEYKIGLKNSSLKIYKNKSYLNFNNTLLEYKNLTLNNTDIALSVIENSSFVKLSLKGLMDIRNSDDKIINELIIDVDKITKFNDRFKIKDVYQINKFRIKNFFELDISGIVFFKESIKLPSINLEIFISNYDDIFDFVDKKITPSIGQKEIDFIYRTLKFYKQDLFPLLKKNEIKSSDKKSLNIKIETKSNNLSINNLQAQEIVLFFNKKFGNDNFIKEQMIKNKSLSQ